MLQNRVGRGTQDSKKFGESPKHSDKLHHLFSSCAPMFIKKEKVERYS